MAAQGELTMERYLQARHVAMRPPDGGLPVFDIWLNNQHGVQRDVGVTTYSFSVIPHLVVGTELLATVHSRLAHKLQAVLPIEIRPLPLAMIDFHQAIQWHKYRSRDPGLTWLRDLLRQAAAGMGGVPSPS